MLRYKGLKKNLVDLDMLMWKYFQDTLLCFKK